MQPYLLPFIGYFQLIACVDTFVIYDNIEYTKKGWINRNRILVNGKDEYFTVPLKKDSNYLNIVQRNLAENRTRDLNKIINKISAVYVKAPYYDEVIEIVKSIILNPEENLFHYIKFSLLTILGYLELDDNIVVASTIDIDHSLKSQDKVIAICKALKAGDYINAIGGVDLYSKEVFLKDHITLSFLKPELINYKQFDNEFVPWLSIIDVLMFNSKETIQQYLKSYTLT